VIFTYQLTDGVALSNVALVVLCVSTSCTEVSLSPPTYSVPCNTTSLNPVTVTVNVTDLSSAIPPTGTVVVTDLGDGQNCTANITGGLGSCVLHYNQTETGNRLLNLNYLSSNSLNPSIFNATLVYAARVLSFTQRVNLGNPVAQFKQVPISFSLTDTSSPPSASLPLSGTVVLSDGSSVICNATVLLGQGFCYGSFPFSGTRPISATFYPLSDRLCYGIQSFFFTQLVGAPNLGLLIPQILHSLAPTRPVCGVPGQCGISGLNLNHILPELGLDLPL